MIKSIKRYFFGRSVQEIFDVVINSGYYSKDNEQWMCCSINTAYYHSTITEQEWNTTRKQIKKYLKSCALLEISLKKSGLPFKFNARLAIYRDWANRPKLNQPTRKRAK